MAVGLAGSFHGCVSPRLGEISPRVADGRVFDADSRGDLGGDYTGDSLPDCDEVRRQVSVILRGLRNVSTCSRAGEIIDRAHRAIGECGVPNDFTREQNHFLFQCASVASK